MNPINPFSIPPNTISSPTFIFLLPHSPSSLSFLSSPTSAHLLPHFFSFSLLPHSPSSLLFFPAALLGSHHSCTLVCFSGALRGLGVLMCRPGLTGTAVMRSLRFNLHTYFRTSRERKKQDLKIYFLNKRVIIQQKLYYQI